MCRVLVFFFFFLITQSYFCDILQCPCWEESQFLCIICSGSPNRQLQVLISHENTRGLGKTPEIRTTVSFDKCPRFGNVWTERGSSSSCIRRRYFASLTECDLHSLCASSFRLSPPQRKVTGYSIVNCQWSQLHSAIFWDTVWFMPARTTAFPRNVGSQRPVTVKTTRDDSCRSPLQRIRVSQLSNVSPLWLSTPMVISWSPIKLPLAFQEFPWTKYCTRDEASDVFSGSLYTYYGFENDGQGFPMLSGCRDCCFFFVF